MEITKPKRCFVNAHCSLDCPNFEIEMVNERYGYGIADDIGLDITECAECRFNSETCENCLLQYSKDCPECQVIR